MGGSRSGRYSWRPLVEAGLKLPLGRLLPTDQRIQAGMHVTGSLTWSSSHTGKEIASIGLEARIGEVEGWVRFRYAAVRSKGEANSIDYRVNLVSTAQPFGGRRWWFVCPKTGRRGQALSAAGRHHVRVASGL